MDEKERVLAELDCVHRFHRFREGGQPEREAVAESRFEAWLDYKQAIFRRDGQRCSRCGQSRPSMYLNVRPAQDRPGIGQMAPDNLVCVCIFCDRAAGVIRPRRHCL